MNRKKELGVRRQESKNTGYVSCSTEMNSKKESGVRSQESKK